MWALVFLRGIIASSLFVIPFAWLRKGKAFYRLLRVSSHVSDSADIVYSTGTILRHP
jgi:hypothetical protein